MPDLDIVYIIVSKEFEKDRYAYLSEKVGIYLKKYVEQNKVIFYEPMFKGRDDDKLTQYNFSNTLLIGEKALYLTYINIFKEILDAKYENVLILESDVLFSRYFVEKLDLFFNEWLQVSHEPSMLFIGNGNSKMPKRQKVSANLHLENYNKCMDTTIMKRSAIERLYSYIISIPVIDKPIDLLLERLWDTKRGDKYINGYWSSIPITTQGSQCGVYKSGIR